MMKALTYADISLVPKYSELKSRSEADTTVNFLGRNFKIPVIPSNMLDTINQPIAEWMSSEEYFYIMHRFGDTMRFVEYANKEKFKTISISVGVKNEDKKLIEDICVKGLRVDYITIDIAHGHSVLMKEMIDYIVLLFSDSVKIIAGNIASREAAEDIYQWGADAVKVGIAGGKACSTKTHTGFYIPMFDCVGDISSISKIPVIADGGIRENGDITKALVAGATMVMAGSIFAACEDSPAPSVRLYAPQKVFDTLNGKEVEIGDGAGPVIAKRYSGSASARGRKDKRHIEGVTVELPTNNMLFSEKLSEIQQDLQSAISYAGGKDLTALSKVQFVII